VPCAKADPALSRSATITIVDVLILVLSVLLSVWLVATFGFPLGLIAFLLIYGVFRLLMSALLKHIGEP
jgi:hypothetical protein